MEVRIWVGASFLSSFSGLLLDWVFQGAKGPPGTQNERFWLPKWAPKAPKMVTKTPQQTPKMQHKRPMLKSRIQILQGHSKEDLRQKGAAAVFRAACSIRRSTAGRVRWTVIHLYVFVYPSSVIFRPSLTSAPGLRTPKKSIRSPCLFPTKIDLDFWSIFGAQIDPK